MGFGLGIEVIRKLTIFKLVGLSAVLVLISGSCLCIPLLLDHIDITSRRRLRDRSYAREPGGSKPVTTGDC